MQFQLFEKIDVNGPHTHPLYAYLRTSWQLFDKKKNEANVIPWNFAKFILDKDGNVLHYASPKTKPEQIRQIIEEELAK